MPRRDGTGPEGNGPGTGRGVGPCKVKKNPTTKYPIQRRQQLNRQQKSSK